jgi:hypothetical protein
MPHAGDVAFLYLQVSRMGMAMVQDKWIACIPEDYVHMYSRCSAKRQLRHDAHSGSSLSRSTPIRRACMYTVHTYIYIMGQVCCVACSIGCSGNASSVGRKTNAAGHREESPLPPSRSATNVGSGFIVGGGSCPGGMISVGGHHVNCNNDIT